MSPHLVKPPNLSELSKQVKHKPKQLSQAQLDANRRNALKSTGPRTPEGKAQSRRNALKHGLTGAGVVLHPEDRERLKIRLAEWTRDLDPQDAVEQWLVGLRHRAHARGCPGLVRATLFCLSLHHVRVPEVAPSDEGRDAAHADALSRDVRVCPASLRSV